MFLKVIIILFSFDALTIQFQALCVLFLSPRALTTWTCKGCQTIVTSMASITSSAEDIKQQTSLLQANLCPTVPDPDGCVRMLPEFWADLAPVLWSAYFGDWMCAEGCSPGDVSLYLYSTRILILILGLLGDLCGVHAGCEDCHHQPGHGGDEEQALADQVFRWERFLWQLEGWQGWGVPGNNPDPCGEGSSCICQSE